jgi:hypothetical protein
MNVKSSLQVDTDLLYRTVSLKLEGVTFYTTKGGAWCSAAVARRLLRLESCVYALMGCTLTVALVRRLVDARWEESIDLSVDSKYVCTIIGISVA